MAKLMRKQYLVTEKNLSKLENISKKLGVSATEIVRRAIDVYDPDRDKDFEAPELMDLVSIRLKETIKSTQRANRVVSKTLKSISTSGKK
mgnify:CR=1 FL=1